MLYKFKARLRESILLYLRAILLHRKGVYLKGRLVSQIYKYDAEQLLCILQKAGNINLVFMLSI